MRRHFFYTLGFLLLISSLRGQDIHFSQFNWSYLNLNPALTGQFDGDYRFNGNFKNQWAAISEPYQTFSFAADARALIKSYKPLNIGMVIYNDEAGLGGLQSTAAALSLSHSFALNYDSSFTLTGGVQVGILSKRVNFNAFSFDQQYNGSRYDPNLSNGENFDRSSYTNLSINAGLLFSYKLGHRKRIQGGISAFNLNSANQSYFEAEIPLDKRFQIHALADLYLSEKSDLIPSLLFSRQGEFQEVLMGSNFRYRLNQSEILKRNLYGGIWYRNQDALILGVGMDYNQWLAGLSYDINLSDLDEASNKRGGLELSVTYIIKTFKPKIRLHKKCPKFL